MTHSLHNIGVAIQIGRYSDAVETAADLRWLYTAGTPGLSPDGKLSESFAEQARQAWANVLALLKKAGMGVEDIVKTFPPTPKCGRAFWVNYVPLSCYPS
jgi:2-iminobutanoate/2-iminopropanoate deaminase